MKSKLKQQKAITLVALIITIIVLLILAMLSISLVINDGIIGKSKHAVDTYSEEEVKEMIGHAYSEYQMAKYSGQTLSLKDALKNSGLDLTPDKIVENGSDGWTITVGEKSYNLGLDGTVTPNTSSSG